MNEPSTLTRIIEFCRLMQEGDRIRVLRFCEAIAECRRGKRQARAARHANHNNKTEASQ